MIKNKLIFKRILKYLDKIAKGFIYFALGLFFFIILQVPIPFVAEKLPNFIYKSAPKYLENPNNLRVGSISLAWSFKLNRPVISFKNIYYKINNHTFRAKKINFFVIFKDKEIYLQRVNVEGTYINIQEIERGSFNYGFDTLNNEIIFIKDDGEENTLIHNNGSNDILSKGGIKFKEQEYFATINNLLKSNSLFMYLEEVILSNSNMFYSSREGNFFIFRINDLILSRKDKFFIDLDSYISFDKKIEDESLLKIKGSFDKNNIIDIELGLKHFLLENILYYSDYFKDDLKFLELEDLNSNLILDLSYNMKESGLDRLNANIKVEKGSFKYRDFFKEALKINNINSNIKYDRESGDLKVDNLVVNFDKNNVIDIKSIELESPLNKIEMFFSFNFLSKSIKAKDIIINIDKNNTILFNFDYFIKNSREYFNISAEGKNIKVNTIKNTWPRKLLNSIRSWIIFNVYTADIDNTKWNISIIKSQDKISYITNGFIDIKNVELSYMEGMPKVRSDSVQLEYSNNILNINYTDAISEGVRSDFGSLVIYDYESNIKGYQGAISGDINIQSPIDNILRLVDKDPLKIPSQANLDIKSFMGDASGKFSFVYSLDESDLISFNVNGYLSEAKYINAFRDNDFINGQIVLKIDNDRLKLEGVGSYLNEVVKVNIDYDMNNDIRYYIIGFDSFAVSKVGKLDILGDIFLESVSGDLKDVLIDYKQTSNDERFSIKLDLKDTDTSIKYLNYNKPKGEELRIRGEVLFDNSYDRFIMNNFITEGNSDLQVDFNALVDIGRIDINFNKFIVEKKADFQGKMSIENNLFEIDFRGKELDISYFSNMLLSSQSSNGIEENDIEKGLHIFEEGQEDNIDYIINLDIDNMINNQQSIKSVKGALTWQENNLKTLDIKYNQGILTNNNEINFDIFRGILSAEIRDIGYLLSFLGVSEEVSKGRLSSRVNISRDEKQNFISEGVITMSAFTLSDTVNFSNAHIDFRGNNFYFDINRLDLAGNIIGGRMLGYFDYNKKYLDISGSLVPIWSATNLLINIPVLKNIFTNSKGEARTNLFTINSRIYGNINDLKFSSKKVDKVEEVKEQMEEKALSEEVQEEELSKGEQEEENQIE